MAIEVITKDRIEDFPFEGIIFSPCNKKGEILDGATKIHYKKGQFLTYPFDDRLDNEKIYDYYIMQYK